MRNKRKTCLTTSGDLPSESKNTRASLSCRPSQLKHKSKNGWSLTISGYQGTQMDLIVATPPNAVVGSWHMTVITTFKDKGGQTKESVCPVYGIYLLFNPWCKGTFIIAACVFCSKEFNFRRLCVHE